MKTQTLSIPSAMLAVVLAVAADKAMAQGAAAKTEAVTGVAACPALLQHTVLRLQDEKPQPLCQYAGKVLLVVNTASYCGFTGQYKGLEELYARLKDKGLVVLGFPSNDFAQETGSNQQIADFCENTFGVKFPMFAKTVVSGDRAHPFFKALAQATGQKPRWNFYKYVIARDGQAVAAYSSMTGPDDKSLQRLLDRLLLQPVPGK